MLPPNISRWLFRQYHYRDVYGVEWQICLLRNVKGVLEFNHKIMILGFMSRHLILWSLENLMVYESLCKGTSYAKGRHITLVHST
jgi:hypothetical protein